MREVRGLAPDQVRELGIYLNTHLRSCNSTHRHTEEFLEGRGIDLDVLDALEACGGYCDCEVLLNVVCGVGDELPGVLQ